jgi:ribosomal protein S24E
MSFADKWLKYLESRGEWVSYIELYGDRPEDMPHTEITTTGEEVKQVLYYSKGMSIPDRIGIDPVVAEHVKIETSDGLIFYISKKAGDERPKMRMRYVNSSGEGLRFEEEETYLKAAKELGYEVVEFGQTDV